MATSKIYIDGNKHEIESGLVPGQTLHTVSGISETQQLLLERKSDIDIPVLSTDHIIIVGGERFSIGDGVPPLEENPCLRKPIRFQLNGSKIDKEKALNHPKITGAELKALDPNSDVTDGLFADLDDLADEPIIDSIRLVVQEKNQFIVTPCGNVGDAPLLDGLIGEHYRQVLTTYPNAQLHQYGNQYLLVLPQILLPDVCNPKSADMLIVVPKGYPVAGLDMFFIEPDVQFSDGQNPGGGDHHEKFLDKTWQRFSWHYHSRKWDPSRDTMISHINFCLTRFSHHQ